MTGLGVLWLLAGAASAAVQEPEAPSARLADVLRKEAVVSSLAWIDASESRAVESLVSLASIVSPSGHEQERAGWLAERMTAIGLADVSVDAGPNVVGRIAGRTGGAVVFVTMLDDLPAVAEHQRASGRPPYREGDRVLGPATDLQSMNAAVLLAAEALLRSGLTPEHDIVIASVAQEETGLIGMKALYEAFEGRAEAWVEVLGDGREIVYGAGTIHWWKMVAFGSEGHTEQTGLPDVNRAIARAVDRILGLPQPDRYDDTFISVGMIQSGDVYNHRPASGWFTLDLRSMQGQVVGDIEDDVEVALERVRAETGVRFEMQQVLGLEGGQVPGAHESRLVRLATEVSRALGSEPLVSPKGCCNMSVPVAQGDLAIGLHGERGGDRATPDEWASVPAMVRAAKHVVLLAAAY